MRDMLMRAEYRLTMRPENLPYNLQYPTSYHYNAYQVGVHRKKDPKLRVSFGRTLPSFQGDLYSHQLRALESGGMGGEQQGGGGRGSHDHGGELVAG